MTRQSTVTVPIFMQFLKFNFIQETYMSARPLSDLLANVTGPNVLCAALLK